LECVAIQTHPYGRKYQALNSRGNCSVWLRSGPLRPAAAPLAAAFSGEAAIGLLKEAKNQVACLCGHVKQVRSLRSQLSAHFPSEIRAFARRSFASGSVVSNFHPLARHPSQVVNIVRVSLRICRILSDRIPYPLGHVAMPFQVLSRAGGVGDVLGHQGVVITDGYKMTINSGA
jgi:hypothetical protein